MTLFHKIKTLLHHNVRDVHSVTQPMTTVDINVSVLSNAAIICRCGSLAVPTQVKGNQYCCIGCDKLMTNISYNLGQRDMSEDSWKILPKEARHIINMDYYNDAMAKLQQRYGKRHRIV